MSMKNSNWCDETGLVAERNGNTDRWDWKGNGNKTWLRLGAGMGMGINQWEREGLGMKKTLPLISAHNNAL